MWVLLFTLSLATQAASAGAADELPTVKGQRVVAAVGGEVVTLDELREQMEPASPADPAADRATRLVVLNRLINVVLIAQEARRMGLDQLPETRKMVESNARVMLREELVARTLKDVRPDEREVESAYRDAIRTWKVSAALFEKQEHATALAAEVAAGTPMAQVAAAYRAAGKATKVEEGVLLKHQGTDAAITAALTGMAVGATSPVITTRSGFVVLRLDDVLYPDDPAARRAAEEKSVVKRRQEAIDALDEQLRKKYAKVDLKLLESLDYDAATPGIDALLKDRRVLADIKGDKPLTVADLTEEIKFQFFHGTKAAAERGQLNARKAKVFDTLLHRRIFRKEALRLKLDRTESYRRKVTAFERSVLFEAVIRKAIAPGVTMSDDDVKAYYDAHRSEYTTPEMMRIRSLAFADVTSAERARESLAKGADFQWVSGRAEGQLPANRAGRLAFDGRPIITTELPEGVQDAVRGARSGDLRLFTSAEKHGYVLVIDEVIPPAPRPFEDVKGDITKIVAGRKIERAVEDYAAKLRRLSDVKVYLRAS
jgi:hypothetical protein